MESVGSEGFLFLLILILFPSLVETSTYASDSDSTTNYLACGNQPSLSKPQNGCFTRNSPSGDCTSFWDFNVGEVTRVVVTRKDSAEAVLIEILEERQMASIL